MRPDFSTVYGIYIYLCKLDAQTVLWLTDEASPLRGRPCSKTSTADVSTLKDAQWSPSNSRKPFRPESLGYNVCVMSCLRGFQAFSLHGGRWRGALCAARRVSPSPWVTGGVVAPCGTSTRCALMSSLWVKASSTEQHRK